MAITNTSAENNKTLESLSFSNHQQSKDNMTVNNQSTENKLKPLEKWSFRGTGSQFNAGLSRSMGNERMLRLRDALIEAYNNSTYRDRITMITIDNNTTPMRFSSIVVAFTDAAKKNVAYFSLLIEASADPIPSYTDTSTVQGKQIEVKRYTSDAVDGVYTEYVENMLKSQFNIGNAGIHSMDGMIIPREFEISKDKDVAAIEVHYIAYMAAYACATQLHLIDVEDFNINNAVADGRTVANISFNNESIVTPLREVVFAPVQIQLISEARVEGERNRSVNSEDATKNIGMVAGFLNVAYHGKGAEMMGPAGTMMMYQQPGMNINPYNNYVVEFVITQLQAEWAMTPAIVVFMATMSRVLYERNNYLQGFRPVMTTGNNRDIHDIVGLKYENPNIEFPDTKSPNFKLEDLGKIFLYCFEPNTMMVSIDVPAFGTDTWWGSVFTAAGNNVAPAYSAIWKAADQLTNHNFSKYFQFGQPIIVNNERVHMGEYDGADGRKHDIREINYLAIANTIGVIDPLTIRGFSDTFTRKEFSAIERWDARVKYINSATNHQAKYASPAVRSTFSGKFLDAVAQGLADCGFAIDAKTPLSSAEFSNQRGTANWYQQATMGQINNSMVQLGSSNNGWSNNGFGYGNTGRWK